MKDTQENRDKIYTKGTSRYFDPCEEESKKSLKCITENPGNKYACKDLINAYKECKKEWTNIRLEERAKRGLFAKFNQGGVKEDSGSSESDKQ